MSHHKIVNGKLYLFYNAFFNNTLKSWNKNEAALKKQTAANCEEIIKPGHAENSK